MTTAAYRLLPLVLGALTLLAHGAWAQDMSPNEILEASRQAIAEIPGFTAQFKMEGEGGSMFADTLPSMSGKLFYGRHDEHGPVIHVIGEAKDAKAKPSKPIDLLLANDRFLWVDRESRVINETPPQKNFRGNPTALTLVLIDSILAEDPYARDANEAQSIELGAREEIAGVMCDQIVIKRKASDRGRTTDAYTDAIWYIGVEDKLPRRVEHVTDADFIKITLALTLSNLTVTDPPDELLDIDRPEGFTLRSRLPQPRPEPAEPAPQPDEPEPVTDSEHDEDRQPAEPSDPRAPSFSFTTVGGSEISNSTQAGRVTVLYFWGSWCVPCATSTPLVSQLAADLSDQGVDVFGLAIRERDPQRVATGFERDGYAHQLVTVADRLVPSFKVRVFPTLVVINQTGEIAFQQGISRETDAQELVGAARQAVESALKE